MLITRPLVQNTALIELAQGLGIEPIILPTLEIRAIPNLESHLCSQLEKKTLVILISQNVVWSLPKSWIESLLKQAPLVFTMGEATTQAAQQMGLSVSYTPPPGATSEGLVDKILQSTDIENTSLLILKGEGGREFLVEALRANGAQVQEIAVYSRHCPDYSDEHLEAIFKNKLKLSQQARKEDCILVTSNQGVENLLKIVERFKRFDLEQALNLKAWRVVVPSERIKQYALSQGFKYVSIAPSARDKDMLAASLSLRR